jgi:hypothetical protein
MGCRRHDLQEAFFVPGTLGRSSRASAPRRSDMECLEPPAQAGLPIICGEHTAIGHPPTSPCDRAQR